MQTKLGHLVFGIDDKNRGFYRDLFTFLGWRILYDVEGMIAAGDSNRVSLWFGSATGISQSSQRQEGRSERFIWSH